MRRFSDVLLSHLAKGAGMESSYAKGTVIHLPGEACTQVDLILEGQVSIDRYDAEGNRIHLTRLTAGDVIGGILLYASEPCYPFEVTAWSPVRLISIGRGQLLEWMQVDSELLLLFLQEISDKSKRLTRVIHTLSEKDLEQRILQYLMEESDRQQSRDIILEETKTLLADRFGVARTSLSRTLKAMQDAGLIRVDGSKVTLMF